MSIAYQPAPRVGDCSASRAQSRLDGPDHTERAGERDHSDEGNQAQQGQAGEWNSKWQQWEPRHGTSPGYRPP